MFDFSQRIAIVSLAALLLLAAAGVAESICQPDGAQASGSVYRICMPPAGDYNGSLIVWAHGFQDATEPVGIPEEQLQFGGVAINEVANALGFGFATNSYSKTGLAVLQGKEDIRDLVDIYAAQQGAPDRVFLVGASEGGIITTLLTEQHPEIFAGGLAVCGPVGDFAFQIDYFGDARATFEYFFGGLIPGDPFHPSPELVENWSVFYEVVVKPVVFHPANASRLQQWVRVSDLPFDPTNYAATVEESVRDVLRYSVVNLNDAAATLGGFPFDNTRKWYRGSRNDRRLNRLVPRVAADPIALQEMDELYDTSGELTIPLVTLHTLLDQQVPYFHEVLYIFKTLSSGAFLVDHFNLPVGRYGHCNVTATEALLSFVILLIHTGDLNLIFDDDPVLTRTELARLEQWARGASLRLDVPQGGSCERADEVFELLPDKLRTLIPD
jgi:pimeloyl-ACP methyl ester carboxylesterase